MQCGFQILILDEYTIYAVYRKICAADIYLLCPSAALRTTRRHSDDDSAPTDLLAQRIARISVTAMQTLQWIVNDFASLGPSFGYASRVQSVPKIGDTAPATPLTLTASKADIIIFTRVCRPVLSFG